MLFYSFRLFSEGEADLLRRQAAPSARREIAESKPANGDTFQATCRFAAVFQHTAHFTVLAFMKREFIFSRSNVFNALRFQEIAAVADAVIRQTMERNGVDLAFDADLIDFTHLITAGR